MREDMAPAMTFVTIVSTGQRVPFTRGRQVSCKRDILPAGEFALPQGTNLRRMIMGSTDRDCWKPAHHPTHMCALLRKGMMMEIDQRSSRPTVACAKCGARADAPESVCQPKPL
jgi:hypothetical protein